MTIIILFACPTPPSSRPQNIFQKINFIIFYNIVSIYIQIGCRTMVWRIILDNGKYNMFEKILDIGVKVYSMRVDELQIRRTDIKKLISGQSSGEVDMELQAELLVINTRLIDEGLMDIDKLDIDERGLMEMYNGF